MVYKEERDKHLCKHAKLIHIATNNHNLILVSTLPSDSGLCNICDWLCYQDSKKVDNTISDRRLTTPKANMVLFPEFDLVVLSARCPEGKHHSKLMALTSKSQRPRTQEVRTRSLWVCAGWGSKCQSKVGGTFCTLALGHTLGWEFFLHCLWGKSVVCRSETKWAKSGSKVGQKWVHHEATRRVNEQG